MTAVPATGVHHDAARDAGGASNELTPLADYLGGVLRGLRPLPPLDLELTRRTATCSPRTWSRRTRARLRPVRDRRLRGPVRRHRATRPAGPPGRGCNVVGDLVASSWRPVRLTPGTCFSVAAGAPLPVAADVVVPVGWTDQGMAAVEMYHAAKRGYGVRRAGEELPAGAVLARAGTYVTPALVAVLAASGIGHVVVRPSPRVVVIATGDELVDVGRASQPGQVVDANSHALTAAAAEAGAHAYRVGICDDDPEGLRGLLEDQMLRADLIITTGGTGTGPGDMVRRILSRRTAPGRLGHLHRRARSTRLRHARLRHRRRRRRCPSSACPATPAPR